MRRLKKAGKPAVAESAHMVQPNAWWGIQGGYEVKLLIVYLDQSTKFEAALPEETRQALGPADPANRTEDTSGEFANYPNYPTTGQQGGLNALGLTKSQVNLLAAQSEYSLRENEQLLRKFLCPANPWTARCCLDPSAFGCR